MKKKFTQWMKIYWLALISVCLGNLNSQAQSIPDVAWNKTGKALSILADGNIVTTEALYTENNPAQVVKYDLQGNRVWQSGPLAGTSYIGGKYPPGFCPGCVNGYSPIANILLTTPTPDDGVLLLGKEFGTGYSILTKIESNGRQSFRYFLSADFRQDPLAYDTKIIFEDLITTTDGGFLLLVTSANPNGKTVAFLQKYNADFSNNWVKSVQYPTPNPATPDRSLTKGVSTLATSDGGCLIVGYYNTTGDINDNPNIAPISNTGWVAKLDGQGNVSWQKLLDPLPITQTFNGPAERSVLRMIAATDVTLAADNTGYALVGPSLAPSSTPIPPPRTAILELDWNGNFKRARQVGAEPTQAFITSYNSAQGGQFYAVGCTSLDNGADPKLLKVNAANLNLNDPALFAVLAERTFDSQSNGFLSELERAGDGSLAFSDGSWIYKLKADVLPPLAMSAPTYNCQTGAIKFSVSGGDGTPITYTAPGIRRASVTDDFGVVEDGLRNDPKVIPITAMQSGKSVTYNFDLKAACTDKTPKPPVLNGPIPDQFLTVGQTFPNGNFLVGSYFKDPNVCLGQNTDCLPNYVPNWAVEITGLPSGMNVSTNNLFTSPVPEVAIGGSATMAGVYTVTVKVSTAAYRNLPIITTFKITVNDAGTPPPSTTSLALVAPDYNCSTGAFTFKTTGGDGTLIEYQAAGITGWTTNPNQFVDRESRTASDVQPFTLSARQSGNVVTYVWDLKATCGRARVGVEEPGTGLQVRVLGNPIEGKSVDVEIGGVVGKAVQLNLMDTRGSLLHQHAIKQAGTLERINMPIGHAQGILLLQVGTATEHKSIKLLKP